MRYVLLIYADETRLDTLPHTATDAVELECAAYRQALRESGHLLGRETLYRSATATTVCVRDGRTTLRDGPHAVGDEQLVGMFLIDARDLNEAIRLGARLPMARFGSIEIRPVREVVGSRPSLAGGS
jgi:hypothetical protein